MPKYFIYCRKSSEAEDRQVLSIESQIRELKEHAQRLNLQIEEVLTESKSAKEPGRPVFNKMMQRVYRGEAAGIICWKLDRLARNPVDGGSVIWAIKQQGIKIITQAQTYAREDDNIILMYIEFGMAQKYVDDLSKNVKRGLKTKIENGWLTGRAPLGYLNNTNRQTGENNLIKDPERFPLVRRMWDLMLTGRYTPAKICDIVNNEWGFRTRLTRRDGGKPIARSRMYSMFRKPFYYGWFEYPEGSGKFYHGKHEPLVTEAEFLRVQKLLGRGSPQLKSNLDFAFTSTIRCGECGCMVTAEEKQQIICGYCRFKFASKNRTSCPRCATPIKEMIKPVFLHYVYYHCSKSKGPKCDQKSISAQELERQIAAYLGRIRISHRFKTWAVDYLHEIQANEIESRNNVVASQQRAYQECLRRLDNLIQLKTSAANINGAMLSDQEYADRRNALLNEKKTLEELLLDTGHRVEHSMKLSEAVFDFACNVDTRFAKGDITTKKQVLCTMGSNLTLKDKKLSIQARKPFFIFQTFSEMRDGDNQTFEPENNGFTQSRNVLSPFNMTTKLGERDDLRTFTAKNGPLVKQVYLFFLKRTLCACADCRSDFFADTNRLAYVHWRRRSQSLPLTASSCLFDQN